MFCRSDVQCFILAHELRSSLVCSWLEIQDHLQFILSGNIYIINFVF